MSGRKRRNSANLPFRQSGGLSKEARKYWVFRALEIRGERFAQGLNGGGRVAGCELSRRGGAKSLVRMRKLAIRLVYATLRSFPPGRDCNEWALDSSQPKQGVRASGRL
jgi:hypothetical protein